MNRIVRGGISHVGLCQGGRLHDGTHHEYSFDAPSRRAAETWARKHAEKYGHDATAETYRRFYLERE